MPMIKRFPDMAAAFVLLSLWLGSATAQMPKSSRLFEQNCIACHGYTPGSPGPMPLRSGR